VDPNDTSILLFPGQGVQYVGMCKELLKYPLVNDLFESASSVLGYDLLKICLEGPQEMLNQTKYCQPAIVVSSLAAVEWLKEERPSAIEGCVATAGFSIGELTALVFAGSLTFESGQLHYILNPNSQLKIKIKNYCILWLYINNFFFLINNIFISAKLILIIKQIC